MGRIAGKNGARKYQITSLWERHHAILRLLALGYAPKQIADELGVTTATIGNVQHGELGKRQLSLLKSAADNEAINIAADIRRLAPVALERLEEILSDDNIEKSLVVKVATDLLDRAGHAAPKVVQGQFLHAHLTNDDIAELKLRAASIVAPTKEDVIDAEEI